MELPYLLVHGAWVWKASLAAIAVLASLAWWAGWRWSARRSVRRTVAQLDTGRDAGVVRGTLRGGGVETLAAARLNGVETFDHRPTDVWIDTQEGRVRLVGALRVIAGSRAAVARRGVPLATPEALVTAAPWLHDHAMTHAVLTAVAPGDEVVARGRIERVAGGDETAAASYRSDAGVVELRALDDAPIPLAARVPRPPRSTTVAGILVVAGLTTGAAALVEKGLGEQWRTPAGIRLSPTRTAISMMPTSSRAPARVRSPRRCRDRATTRSTPS